MKKKLVTAEMIFLLAITLTWNNCTYFVSRIFTSGLVHHDVTMSWEENIPFWPWTITIYWGCYLFWALNYYLACKQDRETVCRFFCAELIAKLICLLFFVFYPTTNVRPEVIGNGVFEQLMRLLYNVDAADNLFPSIHCLVSWFSYVAVRGNDKIPKWYRAFSLIIAVAICLSTLTTKQHAFIDLIGGVGFAELTYYVVYKLKWHLKFERGLDAIGTFFRKRFCEKT